MHVIEAPFVANGNVATAGGCMASVYLAAWTIAMGAGLAEAEAALHYVAPVGEKAVFVEKAVRVIAPFLTAPQPA